MGEFLRCRVATWNIHACVGSDGRFDVPRVAAVLAGLDADIIGLQEVDWRSPMHDGREMLDYLAGQLGMNAVEGPNLHDHRGRYGNGLLSRFNVMGHRQHSLAYPGREPRGAIEATLECGAGTLRVFVTHLGLRLRERRAQVQTLRSVVDEGPSANATVLLGDMNEWISRRLMRRAFTPRPFARMLTGRTFPSRFPCFPLDCIFVRPEPIEVNWHVVGTREARLASDHLPVVADVVWGRCPESQGGSSVK